MNFKGSRLLSKLFFSIKNKSKFTIHGKDYKTIDGTCIRDFIHVKDIALAHVRCIKLLLKKRGLQKKFNLGTGKAYSVLEVLKNVEKITKKKINYRFGPKRVETLRVFLLKIKNPILKTNNSSLKKIILTSWMWFKN